MTRSTVFTTPGILDLDCLTTFGVSVKNTSNPIGRFGTGLKYALAVLMRSGAVVYLSTKGVRYEVKSQPVSIRGQEFHKAYLDMNNHRIELPFTTELGKDWELWQAFRELYSNTLDEGGTIQVDALAPDAGWGNTYITVIHDEFAEIAENKNEYFKEDKTNAIQSGTLGHIHPGDTSNSLFYKGIRVAELNQPTLNAYDISKAGFHLELTEDRTVKYSWEVKQNITALILGCDDVEVVRKAITAPYTSFEYGLDFNDAGHCGVEPSEAFFKAVEMESNTKGVNKSAVKLWEEKQPLRNRFTRDSDLDQFELVRIQKILETIAVDMVVPGALKYEVIPAATLPYGTKSLQDVGEGVIIVDSKLIREDPLGYELAKALTQAVFQMEEASPIESLLILCGFQKGKVDVTQESCDPNYIPF